MRKICSCKGPFTRENPFTNCRSRCPLTPDQGAATSFFLAARPLDTKGSGGGSGLFFDKCAGFPFDKVKGVAAAFTSKEAFSNFSQALHFVTARLTGHREKGKSSGSDSVRLADLGAV